MLYDQIGRNIKRLRLENGMTQARLAELLCVSHQMISKYENSSTVPDVGTLVRLADLFHTSLDRLCGLDQPSRETLIFSLEEKYGEKQWGTFDLLEERYQQFLAEAETVLTDERILRLRLLFLESLHDNIENDTQHRMINERIFDCAGVILDLSRDDHLRSFANYRLAICFSETPFDSPDYEENLALSGEYGRKILLSTYFPEYILPVGTDMRTGDYERIRENNLRFFARKLSAMVSKQSDDPEREKLFVLLRELLKPLTE